MKRLLAFAEFMHTGGSVNWVIAGLYVAVLVLFSERIVYFFRTRYKRDRIFRLLKTGDFPFSDSLRPRAGQRSQPLRMAAGFFRYRDEPGAVLSESLDREAAVIREEMERGLGVLSFIGTAAPLLGLLGTITWLMKAFAQIEARGSAVDIAFLSGGIREAMITTATGLVTAICALACSRWFEHLSASRLRDMSFAVSILGERFRRDSAGGGEDIFGDLAAPTPPQDRHRYRESV